MTFLHLQHQIVSRKVTSKPSRGQGNYRERIVMDVVVKVVLWNCSVCSALNPAEITKCRPSCINQCP